MKQTMALKIKNVLDHYEQIKGITRQLMADPTQDAIDESLNSRANLLDAIANEREKLTNIDPEWKKNCIREAETNLTIKTIEKTITEIGALDLLLGDILQARMSETRKEIGGVYQTSRAASAYTAHIR